MANTCNTSEEIYSNTTINIGSGPNDIPSDAVLFVTAVGGGGGGGGSGEIREDMLIIPLTEQGKQLKIEIGQEAPSNMDGNNTIITYDSKPYPALGGFRGNNGNAGAYGGNGGNGATGCMGGTFVSATGRHGQPNTTSADGGGGLGNNSTGGNGGIIIGQGTPAPGGSSGMNL